MAQTDGLKMTKVNVDYHMKYTVLLLEIEATDTFPLGRHRTGVIIPGCFPGDPNSKTSPNNLEPVSLASFVLFLLKLKLC